VSLCQGLQVPHQCLPEARHQGHNVTTAAYTTVKRHLKQPPGPVWVKKAAATA
jgi:hypothetical protein